MRSTTFTRVVAMTIFSALGISATLAAQEQSTEQQPNKQHRRYKLVDIGTFGGPESNVNPGVNAGPIISRRGTTVGTSATSVPTSAQSNSSLVCGGLDGSVPFVFHAFRWQHGSVTDLGSLPPSTDNCSVVQGVNARGEISGQAENGLIDPLTGFNEVRAVRWKDGKIEELGTLGGRNSVANQINRRGQIVGAALNTIPDPFSFLYQFFSNTNGTQTRAFLWDDGHMRDLGTLGGPDAWAVYVNDRGQVAGKSFTSPTPSASGFPVQDPFLWTKEDGMIDLGGFGGTSGGPTGLNNRGQVIGSSNLAGDQASHPFLWNRRELIDLNTQSGGVIVAANAINDAGDIVGLECLSSGTCDAYLWRNGTITDLGVLAGDCFSQAFAINSRDQVVGQSVSCDGFGRVFLWEDGSMIDLNTFVPPGSGLQLEDVQAINENGEIAGDLVGPTCTGDPQGQDNHCGHAFVLIPCDDYHFGEEGCRDAAESSTAAIQNNAPPIVQNSTRMAGSGLAPGEIASQMRARFAPTRGFALSSSK